MAIKGRLVPVPNLDDRDWRAIKDAMVARIPERTPEWTDHNLSDPGITLIEAFALQMEQLLVRLNQVLPKHLREYLNLIGVTLTPPSAARVICFFRTTVKPTFDITIPAGFEVGTSGAQGEAPVVFSMDEDLVIHAAVLKKLLTEQSGGFSDFTADALDPGTTFDPLLAAEIPYFAYDEDNYFERLTLDVASAAVGVAGVWEFFEERSDGTSSWEPLAVQDGTIGFTQSGTVSFTIPARWEATEVDGILATWFRFRVTSVDVVGSFATLRTAAIDQIYGRVSCANAARVAEEVLGSSDGKPDQRFFLAKVPVLDIAVVVDEGAGFAEWTEVEDFAVSGPEDRHYAVNHGTGEVLFGDGRHGKIPTFEEFTPERKAKILERILIEKPAHTQLVHIAFFASFWQVGARSTLGVDTRTGG